MAESTPVADLVTAPELTVVGLFVEAHAGLHRELERNLEAEAGLSVQWFEVLLRLYRSPDHRLRMSDLAAQTTLTASGLTRAVDRLEAAGLAERQACPSDRRGSFAALTPDGRERVAAALPEHVAHIRRLLEGIDDATLTTLEPALRALRAAVNPCAEAASDHPQRD